MKIRMFMDVPEYASPTLTLYATTKPLPEPIANWTRIAFDVELPSSVFKEYDIIAPPTRAFTTVTPPPGETGGGS